MINVFAPKIIFKIMLIISMKIPLNIGRNEIPNKEIRQTMIRMISQYNHLTQKNTARKANNDI